MLIMRKVCTSISYQYHMTSCDPSAYLQSIAEMLLYLLLPQDDFQNKSLRFILRVIVVEDGTELLHYLPLGSVGRECVVATGQPVE